MREKQIYAYDFQQLARPGEHFLHPCIRGLRERKMYEQLPKLEWIRKQYCWAIRMVGAVWLTAFFSAYYFSVISLKIVGDSTGGHLFGLLQLSAQLLPFVAAYVSLRIARMEQHRLYEGYFNHIRNSQYWPDIMRQNFMQKILKMDPKLELYHSPLFDPFPGYTRAGKDGFRRGFLTPYRIAFYEKQMYEEMPGLKKIWQQYRKADWKNIMVLFSTFYASFFGTMLVMTKIGDAVGFLLRLP